MKRQADHTNQIMQIKPMPTFPCFLRNNQKSFVNRGKMNNDAGHECQAVKQTDNT